MQNVGRRQAPPFVGILALLLAMTACHRARPDRQHDSPAAPVSRPPALENARGIVGGPRDETAFEFEVEPPTDSDKPPVLDGVPDVPEHLTLALRPYLQARRVRISSISSKEPTLVVISRLAGVSQAYRVTAPLGPFEQLTDGDDPVAQAVMVSGGAGQLLFRRDRDGDEQHQIYRRDLSTGIDTRLTDGTSRHGPFTLVAGSQLAYSSNARSPGNMDVYVAEISQPFRPRRLLEQDGQWNAGAWSKQGDRLFVRHFRSAASSSLYIADVATAKLTPLLLGKGEAIMRDARFSNDNTKVYLVSDGGDDFAELHEVDLASGEIRSLSADIDWDVELLAVSYDRSQLAFAVNEDGYSRLYNLDPVTGAAIPLSGLPRGQISTIQFIGATGKLALTLGTATEPPDAFVYDPSNATLERWTESEAEVPESDRFVEPTLVRYPSFDGLAVPAFVYRPAGAGPFPVLLWIHGGPEEQHRPSFDPILQFFVAELGIAVIAPNVRGSTGYGRQYLGLDDGMNRFDAIRDIGALLDWIQAQPDLDPKRVGIYGASYGGYVVLASLIEYGERLAAGCDVVGISHFVRFLHNTSEYRRDLRRAEYGDERDPDMREYLDRISPLSNAHKIDTPLLVAHGANDPRVPVTEAEQIVEAARSNGAEVWYLLARDEGHGFRKQRSRDLFYAVAAAFFAQHLLSDQAGQNLQ